jgi:hypothetical protein
MNAQGDSHLSFIAKHLTASPGQQYLLISTDGGRIIMMNTKTWKQVRPRISEAQLALALQ